MLLIDEYADAKLIKALEALRSQSDNNTMRIVYFKCAGMRDSAITMLAAREAVTAAIGKHLPAGNPHIYLCEDGDIFILAPAFPSRDARQLIVDVASALRVPATPAFAELFEASLHVNRVLLLLEQKIEKRRQAAEALQKQRELAQAERKRQAILSPDVAHFKKDDIARRRAQRSAPELMIIEDDTFSCKLVENVLQKKYSLKSLYSAEDALATYVRLAPDLLFLDINLPDVTGHELLEKIIALDPDAYVIMLSGNADKDNITQAMGRGAKGFIAKPFTREKLFQYIDRCPTITA